MYEVILKSGRSFLIGDDGYLALSGKKEMQEIETFYDQKSGERFTVCPREIAAMHKFEKSTKESKVDDQNT